jgi:hypothetical protein
LVLASDYHDIIHDDYDYNNDYNDNDHDNGAAHNRRAFFNCCACP